MPIIEIDDQYAAELAKLSIPARDRTADFKSAFEYEQMYREIVNGPNRPEQLRLLKKQYPNLPIPEIDAAAPVNAEIEALRKEFTDYRETVKKESEERETARRESAAKDTVSQG